MAKINAKLSLKRAKKNGNYPVIFEIYHHGRRIQIPSKYDLPGKLFNSSTGEFRPDYPKNKVIIDRIRELEAQYLLMILEYERTHGSHCPIERFRDILVQKPIKKPTVSVYWTMQINMLNQSKRYGNARNYKISLDVLHKLHPLNIEFEYLDYALLKKYETQLLKRGVNINSISVYFRTLRAVYNAAIKEKIVEQSYYPFHEYKIKKAPTIPRVLTIDEMRSFFALNITPDSTYYESWLIGKLIFMLRGINYKDLLIMKPQQIKNGYVIYSRSKTKKMYSIKLHPEAENILQYFKSKGGNTVLGLSYTDDKIPEREAHIIVQRTKVLNTHLKKLGIMLNTQEKITSYVFRYSWANIAKQLGFSKDMIAEGLGHEYGNSITGIYLNDYNREEVDEMNYRVIEKMKSN
jgi:integrase/recombinase XerD